MTYLQPGRFFFHYTTREAALEHILPDRELRLSPYGWMRDPLEAKAPWLGAGLTVPDDPEEEAKLHQAYFEGQQLVAKRRSEAKLLSLTIDAAGYEGADAMFGRGFARARMWEQYAEGHRGVCLVFDRDRLNELAEQQIEARAGKAISGPVRYTKTGLAGSAATTMMPIQGITGEELAAEHLAKHHGGFYFLKLVDWESEHEYRFVELTPGLHYTYVGYENALKAIILGEQFPAWQIYGAIELCKAGEAELFQMGWEMNRPLALRPRLPDGSVVEPDGEVIPPASRASAADLLKRLTGRPRSTTYE